MVEVQNPRVLGGPLRGVAIVALAALISGPLGAFAAAETFTGAAGVVDGDTIDIGGHRVHSPDQYRAGTMNTRADPRARQVGQRESRPRSRTSMLRRNAAAGRR